MKVAIAFAVASILAVPVLVWLGSTDPSTEGSAPTTGIDASSTSTTAPPDQAAYTWPEGWSQAPPHPVLGRVFPAIVWTGTEYLVWGGEKPSEGAWHNTGAAFNPLLGTWRGLAGGPLAPRSEHVAVWTGTEVIICCGRQEGRGESAAAYDPSTDSWRSIPPPPLSSNFADFSPAFAEAVWTGEEMIVFGGVSRGGSGNLRRAAAYDPAENTWRNLADLPYGIERQADAVIGDGVIYAWPSLLRFGESAGPLAYDIAADSWQTLSVPDGLDLPLSPSLIWTGRELIAWGLAPGLEGDHGIGVTFEPQTGMWRALPATPLAPTDPSDGNEGSQAAVWSGSEMIVWTGWIGSDWNAPTTAIVAYDPEVETWIELEAAPTEGAGLWHDPLVWTGTQLIAYVASADSLLVYTPPADPR